MKNILFAIAILLFCSFNINSEEKCCFDSIHQGLFISTQSTYEGYYIKRNEDSQIEYYDNNRVQIKSDITWISENEYHVKVTDMINCPPGSEDWPTEYIFKIIHCNGKTHVFEYDMEGEIITFEMKKVKKIK